MFIANKLSVNLLLLLLIQLLLLLLLPVLIRTTLVLPRTLVLSTTTVLWTCRENSDSNTMSFVSNRRVPSTITLTWAREMTPSISFLINTNSQCVYPLDMRCYNTHDNVRVCVFIFISVQFPLSSCFFMQKTATTTWMQH